MKPPKGYSRISLCWVPHYPVRCPTSACPYNEEGRCNSPQFNKGNDDAKCFHWSNRKLIEQLEELSS